MTRRRFGRWGRSARQRKAERPMRRRLGLETLEPRHVLSAANLVISEFMASNSTALADGDGRFSDWIEIQNAGPTTVDLSDYYLTDTADNLRRWEFPARTINPGEYLVVFASSPSDGAGGTLSNYIDAGGNLHTNFSLDADGEYVGLTYEDPLTHEVTIVHEYGPEFPAQRTDISYGIARIAPQSTYLAPGTPAKTIVPTDSTYDAVWSQSGYTPDSNWISGTTGIGFSETFDGFLVRTFQANTSGGSPIGTTVDNIDEALEVIGNPLAQSSVAAGNYGVVNFVNNTTAGGNYDTDNSFFPGLTGADANHFVTQVHAVVTIPTAGNWTFGVASNEGFLLQVDEFEIERFGTGNADQFLTINFATAGNYDVHLFNFERTGSTWLELFAAPGTFTSWNSTSFRLVGDVTGGGLAVVSEVVGGGGASISQLLGTDLRTEMLGVNSTFYTRIPFAVRDPTEFNHLILKMKYDDAFVAHINGTEVARRNVTGATAWNSAADSPRLGDEVLAYEEIDISSFMSLLVPGVNVLAIQGLNVSEADADVLILPEVTATDEISTSTGYFTTPTPGAANGFGFVDIVGDTTFGVDRGFYDAAFDVAITSATTGAQIYYTTNGDAPTQANGILYSGPIHIDKTTTLRAAAFHPGYLPTNVDTQTYLFLNDVIRQSHQATLDAGFPSTWGGTSPDYGMDPDVIGTFDANGNPLGGDSFGGVYAATIKDDLLSIPTLSIVMNTNELFGPNGIYTNSTQRGVAWERATSVELIHPDGAEGFQVDAGIRIQGGAFRSHSLTKKHSLRLLFKNVYGPGKLSFPWFSAGAVDEFNTITLRAGANDGYTWGPAQFTEQYIRDEFGRGLQRAAGHPSSHGTFVHLYINGIYWGLYNPVERPDNEFAASYEGGDPDNWDSIHDGAATEGDLAAWNAMFAKAQQAGSSLAAFMELQGKNLEGTPHATAAPLLDVVNYVDYIAINAWGGNWDWPRKNYWAARDRDPATTTGFKFFNWDFENTMGNNRDRSPLNATALDQDFAGSGNAGQPHLHLLQSPEYRLLFADRVHKMFFNDGILTADKLSVRYQQLADQIERAIVAESARWGDTKHHPPMTLAEWRNERDWILNTYLQQRTGIVLNELKGYGLYPMIVAPSFNQHGGHVPVGFDLSISAPAGAIWYTLDGSDPREIGGATSPTAILHDGTPIEIPAGMTVRARARVGSEWSALNEAAFITGAPANATNLRITELHYNPAAQVGVADPGELEFIEFLNPSSERVSLADVQITQFAATPYTFDSDLSLGPGERMIVARNPAVFQSVYGTGMRVALVGYGGASLSNGGERIAVMGPLGVIQDFVYDEQPPWPTAADGAGASLEIIDPMGDPSDPANWRASFYPGGSPGEEGFSLPGDYDRNRIVDRADHLVWRASFGLSIAPGTAADGNGNGVVDAADYVLWRRNMSLAASATSVASVSAVAASTPIQVIETRRLTAAGRDQGHLTVLKPAPVTTGTSLHSRPAYRPLSPMPGDNAVSSQQLLLDVALPASSSLDSDSAIEDPSKTEDGELAEVAAAVWEELFGSVEILGAR